MLNFCDKCNNLYTYIHTPERQLLMKCQGCGHERSNIDDKCVYFNKFVQNSYDIKIDSDQCHDPTLPNTDQIQCRNLQTCPSNNVGYLVYVEEKRLDEAEFMSKGGTVGQWLLTGWQELSADRREEYNNMAKEQGLTEPVSPRIVFFHYNKDLKLAYICCLCKNYWKN